MSKTDILTETRNFFLSPRTCCACAMLFGSAMLKIKIFNAAFASFAFPGVAFFSSQKLNKFKLSQLSALASLV